MSNPFKRWEKNTRLHDWLKNLAPLFHPIRSKSKLKPIVTRSRTFPALHISGLPASFLIGHNDYFGFGLTILDWKPLYWSINNTYAVWLITASLPIVGTSHWLCWNWTDQHRLLCWTLIFSRWKFGNYSWTIGMSVETLFLLALREDF